MMNWPSSKYYGSLFLFYLIAHGGLLLIPNAIYWDDWTLYQVDSERIYDTFKQVGSMYNLFGYVHVDLLYVGPWLYRVLTFVMMFGAGLALDSIIRKQQQINIEVRYVVVLLFLVLPFYWARVALIDIVYTISYFIFFIAWALIDKYRYVSLVLFFLSFNTNSLLVFYALPFLDLFSRESVKLNIKSFALFCFKRFDFSLIPFVYFVIKIYFYRPYGIYEGYNEGFGAMNLLIAPIMQVYDLIRIKVNLIGVLVCYIVIYALLKRYLKNSFFATKEKSINLLGLGGAIFILGSFPYWLLGHVPSFSEWASRHQLLLPLGGGLFIAGILSIVEAKIHVLSFIISVSMMMNVATYKDFYVDWEKQIQLIALIKNNEDIKNSTIVVFEDKTVNLNAINRVYRDYEWNGLMFSAFGDERRMGLSKLDLSRLMSGEYDPKKFGPHVRASKVELTGLVKVIKAEISIVEPLSIKGKIFALFSPKIKLTILQQDSIEF